MPEDASDAVVPDEHTPLSPLATLKTVLGTAPALPSVVTVPAKPLLESAPASAVVPRTRAQGIQQPLGRLFKAWVRALPGDTSLSFRANSKTSKSAARFSLYRGASTVGKYRHLNPASPYVHEDLAFDLSRGLAHLSPHVWDQRACDSVLFSGVAGTAPASVKHESLAAYTVRAASSVPADFCQDALHDRATRLAPFSSSLRAAAAFEALEGGSPLPPHVGGTLVQELTHEGFMAATVGLREDLKSVAAMALDPLWDVPGGWREKALVELNTVINEKKALVAVTHDEYRAIK
jgi:hypothetical protein